MVRAQKPLSIANYEVSNINPKLTPNEVPSSPPPLQTSSQSTPSPAGNHLHRTPPLAKHAQSQSAT